MQSAVSKVLATIALATCAAACHAAGLEPGAECDASDTCATGLTCAQGACRAPCNLSSDCEPSFQCEGGLCVPGTSPKCTASACTSPPTCYKAAGAYCFNDACAYETAADGTACTSAGATPGVCVGGQCIDCLSDSNCDPRDFGRDLCYTGTCVDLHCTFTPVSNCTRTNLGSPCSGDTCKSGYCANGRCCESECGGTCEACGNDGRCNLAPSDDSRCGTIDCDSLDTTCRNYSDYNSVTRNRCKAFQTCRAPNSADCQLYTNAAPDLVCRSAALPCDQDELCTAGLCPADANLAPGTDCYDPQISESGVCTDIGQCLELPTVNYGVRYFIEEANAGSSRNDALGVLDLTQSGTGISNVSLTTGRGVHWAATSSTGYYCSPLSGTDFAGTIQQATIEAVVTVVDGTDMPGSIIATMGSGANRLELLATRVTNAAAGQVTFTGIFGNNTFAWTTTISARSVVHLVVDGTKAASSRLLLYVNGVSLGPSPSSSGSSTSVTPVAGDSLCVGNDANTTRAFVGTLFYAALYTETLDATQISHAAGHLRFNDAQ